MSGLLLIQYRSALVSGLLSIQECVSEWVNRVGA